MGKGNRTENEKASELLASAKGGKAAKAKKGLPVWAGTLILVAVLVALVLIATFSALNAKGVFLHGKTVASTEHYKINAAMMSYVIYSEYQNFVTTYSSSSYGNILAYIRGTGGDALSTSTPLRSQYYSKPTADKPETEKLTWFDYFAKSAESQVTQILIYCEIARANGVELDDEDRATIESTLDSLKTHAETQGYSVNDYLMAMYGKGVNLKEVRKILELSQLSSKMANKKQDEYKGLATDVRVDAEYEANRSKYDLYYGYIAYTFTAKFEPKSDATDEEKAAALEAYKAEQKKYAEWVERLKGITDQSKFETFAATVREETFERVKAEELEKGTDEEEATKLANEAADAVAKELSMMENKPHYKKGDDSGDLDTWISNVERALGDTTTVISEADATNKTAEGEPVSYVDKAESTYSVYMLTATVHPDSGDRWRSVGHILFKSDTYDKLENTEKLTGKVKELADKVLEKEGAITAEAMAKALLEELMNEGKITTVNTDDKTYYMIDKNVFEEYGKIYTEDGNVFYTDVKPGAMVKEFENWLMDSSRVVGEISYPEAIKSTYGYHIMTYTGDEKLAWKEEIRDSLANTDFENWYNGEKENITVNVNMKAVKSISG